MLCTSLPHSLLELQQAYSALYATSAVADLRAAAMAERAGDVSSGVGALMARLLEGAAHAVSFSAAAQIEPDVTQLRYAIGEHSALRAAEAVAAVIDVFSRRTRAHMREVAAAYLRLTGASLAVSVKARCSGDLQRALMLLLEPAEVYFARKLHGALHGVKATEHLDQQDLLGSKATLWGGVQTSRGFLTHNDTLVAVVAARLGRDLSAVCAAYQQLYRKSLAAEITANTYGDLRRLLAATVEGAVALAQGAGPSS